MTIIITSILIVSLLLIATERQTNINKATIAVFAATLGWVLYICFGADFVASQHQNDYLEYLNGLKPNSDVVKEYISRSIFLPYIGHAAEIVLFLIATMSIVEILHTNGCFDFLTIWIRTKNSKLLMWKLTLTAFIMSANLDNISTIVLMLTITNSILPRSKDRKIFGSMVLLSIIFGGALTVIGDPTGLVLWNKGAITASDYTFSMFFPCVLAWAIPTLVISQKLNSTVEIETSSLPYRGDDTNLNTWQRLLFFFVGIGGLWFIPTFHDLTKLPPFLGALCVLSLLWIVNEVINHNILKEAVRRINNKSPHRMQYNTIQQMLYIVGVILALGVVIETGSISWFAQKIDSLIGNVWIIGIITALISTILDSFASCITMISLHDVITSDPYYSVGGAYWKVLSFGTAMGGSILGIGSMSGIIMMQMQGVTLKWYAKHITPLTLAAGVIAFSLLCLQLTVL